MGTWLQGWPEIDPAVIEKMEESMWPADRDALRELLIYTSAKTKKVLRQMGMGNPVDLEVAQEAIRAVEAIVAATWWEGRGRFLPIQKTTVARIFGVPVETIADEVASAYADSEKRATEAARALRDALDAKREEGVKR